MKRVDRRNAYGEVEVDFKQLIRIPIETKSTFAAKLKQAKIKPWMASALDSVSFHRHSMTPSRRINAGFLQWFVFIHGLGCWSVCDLGSSVPVNQSETVPRRY